METRQRKNTHCYVFIGATGQGKNTLADKLINITERSDKSKNCLNAKPCFIYDVQNNYPELPMSETLLKSRFYGQWKDFVKKCENKRDTWILFDEATASLQGLMPENLRHLVVSKQWHGNNWIFLFHTIRSVPPFLLDTADFIVLFKTGDDISEVKRRRSKLLKYFVDLQNKPQYSKHIIKNI